MQRTAHIEAELTFLTTEGGGRRSGVASGYRPQFHYGSDEGDVVIAFLGVDGVLPGETAKAQLSFLRWDIHGEHVHETMQFAVREGSRIVARGKVTKILPSDARLPSM